MQGNGPTHTGSLWKVDRRGSEPTAVRVNGSPKRLKFSCAPRSCETLLRNLHECPPRVHDRCRTPLARLCQPGATGKDDCAHMLSRQFAAQWRGAGAGRHADLQMPYLQHATLARGSRTEQTLCISGAHATLDSLGWFVGGWWSRVSICKASEEDLIMLLEHDLHVGSWTSTRSWVKGAVSLD